MDRQKIKLQLLAVFLLAYNAAKNINTPMWFRV